MALAGSAALVGGYVGVSILVGDEAAVEAAGAPPPPPTTSPAPRPSALVVHATGDVNLDPRQLGLLAQGPGAPWSGVAELFAADDLTIANLECAASELGEPVDKEYNFRCDTGALPAMREAGVEVANLGNNHSGDYGPEALLDAIANVEGAGMSAVGAGENAAAAASPALFEVDGRRVAVLGFGGVVPDPGWLAGPSHPGQADGYSVASMRETVSSAAGQADIVLVTIHWGDELEGEPNADDVERAHALIDAGADAVFGHHSHRLQPLEWYRGKPIFYGLGNFVWPAYGPGAVTGLARVTIDHDGTIEACLLPAKIVGGRPELVDEGSCADQRV